MKTVQLRLVTIIAEPFLQDEIIDQVKRLGAKGYTLSYVEGEGSRGVRASEWAGPNPRIEVLVTDEVADAILEYVAGHYFEYHAVVAYVERVEVVRGDKYI